MMNTTGFSALDTEDYALSLDAGEVPYSENLYLDILDVSNESESSGGSSSLGMKDTSEFYNKTVFSAVGERVNNFIPITQMLLHYDLQTPLHVKLLHENITKNTTFLKDIKVNDSDFPVHLVTVLICLLGLVGNGAVIWLLGFRVKRNPFSVYILNLAVADFTFLLANSVWLTIALLNLGLAVLYKLTEAVEISSFLVGLSLLMAVSTERCVSVLWPLWYRCHRPAHLSSILCALIWGLGSCSVIAWCLCFFFVDTECPVVFLLCCVTSFLTFLVLCVSSLTLLIRVQCSSRRRQPSRLYLTILLSVLAFLLLTLPYGVATMVHRLSPSPPPYYGILRNIFYPLLVLNSVVNPIIYFFVGRHRQLQGRKPLGEVLQSALTDEEEMKEQCSEATVPRGAVCLPGAGVAVLPGSCSDLHTGLPVQL